MTLSEQLPTAGTRISYASNLGTVRYVGEVEGTSGSWLGVEWDDARRGRHSGTKNNKQYFTCTVPNSATFVRPSAAVFGQSFLRALSSKYVEVPLEKTVEKVLLGSSNGAIEVEAVDMDKVRSRLSRLERLREVSLDMENIACADAPGEIREKCPNIRGLDISRNLLPSWETVALITGELPLLETLSLNFNRLQSSTEEKLRESFSNIQHLRLNGTMTTWETMMTLLPSFPKLLHLELGLNHLQFLTGATTLLAPTKLASLNLDENELTSWQNIMESVSHFSQLHRLILSGNMIASITPPPLPHVKLPQIHHLALISNSIRSWSDVNALGEWLPELQTLNVNMTPIDQEPSSRLLIIARLPTLTTLNASAVSSAERRDSELFYLSAIAKDSPRPQRERECEFPRYRELCEKFGEPEEHKEVHSDILRNHLIEIHMFRMAPPTSSSEFELPDPAFTLRVLPSMALRLLCSKVLKTLKLSLRTSIRMWLVLERGSLRELVEMEHNNRPLEWWGVENDCKITFCTK